MASPRDQRLRKIVADASKTVSERREALLGMTAPAHKWLRKLIGAAATPAHLRSTAERVLADAEAARNAKREAVRQARTATPPAQPIAAQTESVPVSAPMAATPASVADLLAQSKARTLAGVDYQAAHSYCAARGWSSQAHEVFAAWRTAYFAESEQGKKDLAEIRRRLRAHDFDSWKHAADVWRDSNWKDGRELLTVLQRIAEDPAGVHDSETREGAATFLAEVRRRCQ